MARLFNDAASDYIEAGSAVVTAYPLTMACWAYLDDAGNDVDSLMSIGNSTGNGHYFGMDVAGVLAGDPFRVHAGNGAGTFHNSIINTSGTAYNTWNHYCGVFSSSTSRIAYYNATAGTTDSFNLTPSGLNRTQLGCTYYEAGAVRNNPMSGRLAEAAIWNVALTQAEITALAKGVSPALIRPSALVFYVPLVRDILDRKGNALTTSGTTVAEHPRIILPRRRTIYLPATSAGTVVGAGGVSAVGAIGTVTATGGALVQPTGLSATGDVGSVTVGIVETVSVSGVSASGSVGAATVTAVALVEPTGVSATGGLGSVTVTAGVVVEATGVSAAGQVGTVTTTYDMAFAVSGVSGTGDVGAVTISGVGDATADATGVSASGSVGSVTVAGDQIFAVTGNEATGSLGTVTATGGATVAQTGVSAAGELGTATVTVSDTVAVTGVSATASVGSATVTLAELAVLAGLGAVGSVGNVGVSFDMVFAVTGLSATGLVGDVEATGDAPPFFIDYNEIGTPVPARGLPRPRARAKPARPRPPANPARPRT